MLFYNKNTIICNLRFKQMSFLFQLLQFNKLIWILGILLLLLLLLMTLLTFGIIVLLRVLDIVLLFLLVLLIFHVFLNLDLDHFENSFDRIRNSSDDAVYIGSRDLKPHFLENSAWLKNDDDDLKSMNIGMSYCLKYSNWWVYVQQSERESSCEPQRCEGRSVE